MYFTKSDEPIANLFIGICLQIIHAVWIVGLLVFTVIAIVKRRLKYPVAIIIYVLLLVSPVILSEVVFPKQGFTFAFFPMPGLWFDFF